MATGVPASPEIGFLGDAIERDMTDLPVTYQGINTGAARICHVLLASYRPSTSSRGWRLKVVVYASGITQNEILLLAGLLVRWEGVGLNQRQEGIWNLGHLGADSWLAVYSLDILDEQIYPGGLVPQEPDPAMDLVTNLNVNNQDV